MERYISWSPPSKIWGIPGYILGPKSKDVFLNLAGNRCYRKWASQYCIGFVSQGFVSDRAAGRAAGVDSVRSC